jgi:16S rRNA G966 N2-methylase RsmD
MVYFVEAATKAVGVIRANLKAIGIADGFDVIHREAMRALGILDADGVRADYIFLDPPYRMDTEYRQVLEFLSNSHCVHQGTAVIAEHDKRFDPGEKFGELVRTRVLKQGDAALSFYKRSV